MKLIIIIVGIYTIFEFKVMNRKFKQVDQNDRNPMFLFVQHCAIIIQSRFKAFIQRKKYKSFLPIYRRVKQLLVSVYLGWKIRRIMNLPRVKNQILTVRNKIKKNQPSSSRIAKRQLIDDIERLCKKGKWIEFLSLNRSNTVISNQYQKENNSLYGNIKSKSIKNIFKNIHSQIQPSITFNIPNKTSSIISNHNQKAQHAKQNGQCNKQVDLQGGCQIQAYSFDQMPIKSNQYVFSQLLSLEEKAPEKVAFNGKKSKKKKSQVANSKRYKVNNEQANNKLSLQNIESITYLTSLSQSIINKNQSINQQSNISLVQTANKAPKIKLSLSKHHQISKNRTIRNNQAAQDTYNDVRSFKQIEIYTQNKRHSLQNQVYPTNADSKSDIFSVYMTQYRQKQSQITFKLSNMDNLYCPQIANRYKQILHRLKNNSYQFFL